MLESRPPGGGRLQIHRHHDGAGLVIAAVGEIDSSTRLKLSTALTEALEGYGAVVVDLSAVTFMDSSGLGVLLSAQRGLATQRRSSGSSARPVPRAACSRRAR
jgi:anti-anti-sigma factor